MMIRSIPPASAHLALIPVPAPPPMIGLPAATWARRRLRDSSRVKKLMAVSFAMARISYDGYGKAGEPGPEIRTRTREDRRDVAPRRTPRCGVWEFCGDFWSIRPAAEKGLCLP